MLLNTPTTTKDDCQYGKSIPDNQLSANTSQSTIRSRDDYRQLSSSPTTMKSNRKTINPRRKNRRATFDIHRQPQVNATIYLLLVDINAQCKQTWLTSTIGDQHSATIGNQKHNTPQSKTANNCRKGTKEGTKWRAYLYPKPQ